MELLVALAVLVAVAGLGVFYYALYRGGRFAWERQTPEERHRTVRFALPALAAMCVAVLLLAILDVDPRSREFWRGALWLMGGAMALGFIGGALAAIWHWLHRD